jgi:hypothetical protein
MASDHPELERPAFYALASGGWRDLLTLLHPPYTVWHLSYVVLGAAAATKVDGGRLLATLVVIAVTSLAGAIAIGVLGAITVSPLLIPLVIVGGALVPAYNLELAGGRFHNDLWFALAWGGFPAFTGFFAQSLKITPAGVLVAAGCCLLSAAQRRLSTPVRELRRRTVSVTGVQTLTDGSTVELTKARLTAPLDGALSTLWIAVALLAAGVLLVKL